MQSIPCGLGQGKYIHVRNYKYALLWWWEGFWCVLTSYVRIARGSGAWKEELNLLGGETDLWSLCMKAFYCMCTHLGTYVRTYSTVVYVYAYNYDYIFSGRRSTCSCWQESTTEFKRSFTSWDTDNPLKWNYLSMCIIMNVATSPPQKKTVLNSQDTNSNYRLFSLMKPCKPFSVVVHNYVS